MGVSTQVRTAETGADLADPAGDQEVRMQLRVPPDLLPALPAVPRWVQDNGPLVCGLTSAAYL